MSTTKIGPKHQVTIPKDVFEELHLDIGDILEAEVEGDKLVLVPKRLVGKAPAPKLTAQEQRSLARARKKVEAIRVDLCSARGLTTDEAAVAAKVGVIDPDQRWWWMEDWQKGEREAEQEIRTGKTSRPFSTADEFVEDLKRRVRSRNGRT